MSDYREFILNPEISSLLNNAEKDKNKVSLEKFISELKIFIKEGIKSPNLAFNKGQILDGTNIKISLADINPYNSFEAHPDRSKNGGVMGWLENRRGMEKNLGKNSFYVEISGGRIFRGS